MAITFTPGLTPTFNSYVTDSALESTKQITTLLVNFDAYLNKLKVPLDAALATSLTRKLELAADRQVAMAVNGSSSTVDTLLWFQNNISNCPLGWTNAGYFETDFAALTSNTSGYISDSQGCENALNDFSVFVNSADADFKLHMDLLSGQRFDVPPNIIKPNLFALMGIVRGLTDFRDRLGYTFINYLVPLFGTLFTGDDTIATFDTFINTDPIPTTYASLDIINRVSANPFTETPAAIAGDISAIRAAPVAYGGEATLTHKAAFQTHITDDTNEYNAAVALMEAYMFAQSISTHIDDDYYKFMYTDVFGTEEINAIIDQIDEGTIT